MAYDRDKIYKQAEQAIKDNNLFFIEDIVAFVPCGKTAFYEFFPLESNELNTLKGLLEENKIKTKAEIRAKLGASGKAAELLALYRLIATSDEHKRLNQSYIDHTTGGKELDNRPTIVFNDGQDSSKS
jgi:hypothetical protein